MTPSYLVQLFVQLELHCVCQFGSQLRLKRILKRWVWSSVVGLQLDWSRFPSSPFPLSAVSGECCYKQNFRFWFSWSVRKSMHQRKATLCHTSANLLGASNGVRADVFFCREVEVPFRVEQTAGSTAHVFHRYGRAQLCCIAHVDKGVLTCMHASCVNRGLEVSCTGSGRSMVHFSGVDGVFGWLNTLPPSMTLEW